MVKIVEVVEVVEVAEVVEVVETVYYLVQNTMKGRWLDFNGFFLRPRRDSAPKHPVRLRKA